MNEDMNIENPDERFPDIIMFINRWKLKDRLLKYYSCEAGMNMGVWGHFTLPDDLTPTNIGAFLINFTRTGGGGQILPPPVFANNLKTAARSGGILDNNSRINLVCKFWLPRSKGWITRSGRSQMCTSGPASNFNFALWVQL